MKRRERLTAKAERRREWADKARARGGATIDQAHGMASGIPLGQPILVGHHSEHRDRRYRERISRKFDRGCELLEKADHHDQAAAGLEVQLERSIYSDDTDAIEQLRARIAEREAEADRHAAINKAWRKGAGKDKDHRKGAEAVIAAGLVSAKLGATMLETTLRCPWLDGPLDTKHLRASIRRDKERIADVEKRLARSAAAEAAGGVTIEGEGEWCRVTFADKPEREVLSALRAAGFRWGGGSWVGRRARLPADLGGEGGGHGG
jgi:hypothetical protein